MSRINMNNILKMDANEFSEIQNGIMSSDGDMSDYVANGNNWNLKLEFIKNRAESYPNIGEQLDMLWHAIDTGTLDKTSDFYTSLKAVKDTYPKPE